MLSRGLLKSIAENSSKYASEFRKTKDFKWLIRFAQESKLYNNLAVNNVKSFLVPMTIKDFLHALVYANSAPVDDNVQNILNHITVKALLKVYSDLDPTSEAFNTNTLSSIDQALVSSLLVGEKNIEDFNKLLISEIGNLNIDDKYQDILLDISQDEDKLFDAIKYVLTRAYLYAYDLNLYRNPVLAVIPGDRADDLQKNAGHASRLRTVTSEAVGPRLSDVIESLKIISGKYTINFARILNKIEQLEKKGINPRSEPGLIKSKNESLRTLLALDAYIDYFKRMKSGVEEFMKMNPANRYLKWGEKGRDFITDDPYIMSAVKEPKNFADYFRAPLPSGHKAKFEVKLWNDQPADFSKFGHGTQSNIVSLYIPYKMKEPGYQNELVNNLQANAVEAQKHFENENRIDNKIALQDILGKIKDSREISTTYEDIKNILSSAIPPMSDAMLDLAGEVGDDPEFDEFTRDRINEYENKLRENIENSKNKIFEKYGRFITKQPKELTAYLNKILRDEILALTPLDLRLLKTFPDYKFSPSEGTQVKELSIAMGSVGKDIQDLFNTKRFQTKFLQNAADMQGYKHEHDGDTPSQFLVDVQKGKEILSSEAGRPILDKLGIVRIPAADHDEFAKQFDVMVNKAVKSRSQEELQKILGSVPLDSLFAYLSDEFLIGMEHHLTCLVARRFGGAKEIRRLLDEGEEASEESGPFSYEGGPCPGMPINEESYKEAQRVVENRIKALRQTKGEDRLRSITGAGAVRDWYTVPDFEKANFSPVFIERAKASFGTYMRDEGYKNIKSILEKNLEEKESAERQGHKFVWDDWNNPKPTNWAELYQMTGAFADPLTSKERQYKADPILQKERSLDVLAPGTSDESDEELQELGGEGNFDTVTKHVQRLYTNKSVGLDPVADLRSLFFGRRQKIIDHNPEFKDLIIPYDITKTKKIEDPKTGKTKTVNLTNDPFGLGYRKPPEEIEDRSPKNVIRNRADAVKFIDSIPADLLPPAMMSVLKKNIMAKGGADAVFSGSDKFYDFLMALSPMLEGSNVNLNAILELLVPGKARAAPPPRDLKKDLEDTKVGIDLINKKIAAALQSVVPANRMALSSQVDKMQQILLEARSIIDKTNSMSVELKSGLKSDMMSVLGNISKLQNEINLRKQRIQEHMEKEQEAERGDSLMNLSTIVNQILEVVQGDDFKVFWQEKRTYLPKEGIINLVRAELLSLIGDESNDNSVHTEAIPQAVMLLGQFLSLATANKVTYDILKMLKKHVDGMRNKNFELSKLYEEIAVEE